MPEHDLKKLLGGFAADTLTAEERQRLYTAALNDQQLFNALADEQALKELLADPDVRRRLLAVLEQTSASGAGDPLSWLNWFRRPVGLAFAGGLSAAALAVVLGVRIYQDSLSQSTQSVRTEEVASATPQAIEPQEKTKENVAPAIDLQKKDTLINKPALKERSTPLPSKKERASDAARDSLKQHSEQDEVRREAEAPGATPSKSVEKVTSSADQKLAAPPVSPVARPALSARALFYGGAPARADARLMAKEHEQTMKPLVESAPQTSRLERKSEGLSQLGKAAGTVAQLRPLGLRYSFVVRGTDGQENEVDAATASKSIPPVFLTMEANQDTYLQIWETDGSSTHLLWPEKETGQTSLKITLGQRQRILLPMKSGPVTLTVRLSRVRSEPTPREGTVAFDRIAPNQLQESVTENNRTGTQEHAAYVVNQDPSITAQISIDISLNPQP
jgi:hypothetical protein